MAYGMIQDLTAFGKKRACEAALLMQVALSKYPNSKSSLVVRVIIGLL
jgi:hypothetical protein